MTNNQLAENSVIQLLNSVKLARDNAERADNRVDHSFYYALTIALEELQERRKAAMDSEPVACGNGCSKSKWHKMALDIDEYMNGEDARESKGRDEIYSEIILRLTRLDVLETILRNEIGLPYGSPIPDIAEKIYDIKRARIYSVVPDDVSIFEAAIEECKTCDSIDEHAWNHGVLAVIAKYEFCRAAMLQELKKSAGTEAICRSDENVQVLHTKSPAQSDCCPAQNHVSPEQNGDTPAQSQGWIQVSEQMPPSRHEVLVGRWWGEKPRWCCKWATYIPGQPDAQSSGWLIPGASWTPTHWMPLPAEPQEVKSES
nr:DUF551 domain-containing protein [Klebsiella variicola]